MNNTRKMMGVVREIVAYYSKDLELAKSVDTEAIIDGMDKGEENPELKATFYKVMKRMLDLNEFLMRIDAIFDASAGMHPSVGTGDDRLDMTSMQYYTAMRARLVVSMSNFEKLLPYIMTNNEVEIPDDYGAVFGQLMKESIERAEEVINGKS